MLALMTPLPKQGGRGLSLLTKKPSVRRFCMGVYLTNINITALAKNSTPSTTVAMNMTFSGPRRVILKLCDALDAVKPSSFPCISINNPSKIEMMT
jgi:hypothetical protein